MHASMTLMLMTPLILRLLASIRLRGFDMKKKQEFGPRNLLLQGRKVQQIGHCFSRTIMAGWVGSSQASVHCSCYGSILKFLHILNFESMPNRVHSTQRISKFWWKRKTQLLYIYIYIYIVIYMNGTYYIQLVQNQLHYKDGGNEEIDVEWARFHVLFFLRGPNVVIWYFLCFIS